MYRWSFEHYLSIFLKKLKHSLLRYFLTLAEYKQISAQTVLELVALCGISQRNDISSGLTYTRASHSALPTRTCLILPYVCTHI